MNMRRGLLILGLITVGIAGSATVAHAATMYLSPAFSTAPAGGQFSIDVKIDTESAAINAAEGTLQFEDDLIEFVGADLGNSAFSLWLQEPTAAAGTITFTGGTPKGVAGGALHIVRLTFRARGTGTAQFSFSSGAIAASDGKGTNVLTGTSGANVSIGGAAVTATPTPITSVAPGMTPTPTPEAPVTIVRTPVRATSLPPQPALRVPFYPDPVRWYNRIGEAIVLWDVPADITRISVLVNEDPNTEPTQTESNLTTGKRLGTLDEGVWYVHVQFRNSIGWGPVAHYRIAIDTTVPLPFEAEIDNSSSDNPTPTITFESADSLSGVEHALLSLDGGVFTLASGSPLILPPQAPGMHTAVIRVVDVAGNSTEDDVLFEILPLPTPSIDFITTWIESGDVVFVSGSTLPSIFVDVTAMDDDGVVVFRGETQSGENGSWGLRFGEELGYGKYRVIAQARDSRGAVSYPTESVDFSVRSAPIISIGALNLGLIEVIIIAIALLLAAVGIGGWYVSQYRLRKSSYSEIAVRDMEKMNVIIKDSLTNVTKLVHGESKYFKQKTMKEVDLHLDRATKATGDISRYVTDMVRKTR